MQGKDLNIEAIPAFNDNYVWLLETGGKTCAVVDPGEAKPVLEVLQRRGLELAYILLTHHHPDHIGGVPTLLNHYQAQVFAPNDERIGFDHQVCREGDTIRLPDLNAEFQILETVTEPNGAVLSRLNDGDAAVDLLSRLPGWLGIEIEPHDLSGRGSLPDWTPVGVDTGGYFLALDISPADDTD